MNSKVIGSILMILGTSIGAGMLALPIASAEGNYLFTLVLMLLCWGAMTLGAFSVLEVNLWLPPGSNMVTMAKETLGNVGKIFSWVIYLLLLYSLLCAYLSGGSDILQALLGYIHINIPSWTSTLLALLILGSVVYRGVSSIDMVNRLFMGTKLIAYVVLVLAVMPHIKLHYLLQGNWHLYGGALMVMITSFGYAIIVPSLRSYLESDVKKLKRVVLIGSLLPLIIYLLWIGVVQGLIPRIGTGGLLNMLESGHANSMLMATIGVLLNHEWLAVIAKLFISICAVTSFLGVSLCITDFVADGLSCKKTGRGALKVYGVSYLPPLVIVLLAPGIFVRALSYAGIYCVLLLIVLPILMLLSGRYWKKIAGERIVRGGKVLLVVGLIFAVLALLLG